MVSEYLFCKYCSMVSGLLISLLGGGIVYYAYRMHRKQQDALINSTNVLGTITRVDIESRTRPNRSRTYYPVVEYEYQYLGEQYTGDDMYPGTGWARFGHSDEADAHATIEAYDVGQEIPVYVHNNDPTRAFLRRDETTGRIKLIAIAGGMVLLFGLSAFLLAT